MKKFVILLAILAIAVPAMATVTIQAVQVGDTNQVQITYSAPSAAELPRAFGLTVSVDAGTISNLAATLTDYYVEPGAYTYDSFTQTVTSWGDGIAESNDVEFVMEMGSLYAANDPVHTTAPALTGVLATFNVSETTNVCIALDSARGGVVLENPATAATTNLPACFAIDLAPAECVMNTAPFYADWVNKFGSPACWCYAKNCRGDADGTKQGSSKLGYWYVGSNDLAVLVAAWQVKEPAVAPTPSGPGIMTISTAYGAGICADFARNAQGSSKLGYWRVGSDDLAILVTNWQVKEPAVAPTPSGPGVADCELGTYYNFFVTP